MFVAKTETTQRKFWTDYLTIRISKTLQTLKRATSISGLKRLRTDIVGGMTHSYVIKKESLLW
jgi:hypothetical protein